MRGIGYTALGIAVFTMGLGAQLQAQSSCPASGSELVLLGGGGRGQGGGPPAGVTMTLAPRSMLCRQVTMSPSAVTKNPRPSMDWPPGAIAPRAGHVACGSVACPAPG